MLKCHLGYSISYLYNVKRKAKFCYWDIAINTRIVIDVILLLIQGM